MGGGNDFTILMLCFVAVFHFVVIVVIIVYGCCRNRKVKINNHTTNSRSQVRASLSRTSSLATRRDSLADTLPVDSVVPDDDVADESPAMSRDISQIPRVTGFMQQERRSMRRPPHRTVPPTQEHHVSDVDETRASGNEDSLPPNYDDCIRDLPGYHITESGDIAIDKPPSYEDIA